MRVDILLKSEKVSIYSLLTPVLYLSLLLFVAQSLHHIWLFATPRTAECQASLFLTNSWSLIKLMSIKSVIPSNHLLLCRILLLLPSIYPSIKVFFNESFLRIRWPKQWSFSFSSVFPMNIQDGFPLGNFLVGSPCSPRDSLRSETGKPLFPRWLYNFTPLLTVY